MTGPEWFAERAAQDCQKLQQRSDSAISASAVQSPRTRYTARSCAPYADIASGTLCPGHCECGLGFVFRAIDVADEERVHRSPDHG